MKITGRSSSITNAFINSIIPVVPPSAKEIQQALEVLGMTYDTFQCVYCGGVASEWDHLRPLVKSKNPTGYISEIHNLVPSCGKCNQSKGNKEWKKWMVSGAKLAPANRAIKDLGERIKRLEAFENWSKPTKMDFESVAGKDLWSQHWENCEGIQSRMRDSQKLAAEIKHRVALAHKMVSVCTPGSEEPFVQGLKVLAKSPRRSVAGDLDYRQGSFPASRTCPSK